VIIVILLAALIFAAFKKELKIPLVALPYFALPILLFISVNGKLEYASNDRLLCLSMLIGAFLIFAQKELYSKWLFRSMLICGNLHLIIQIFAIIVSKGNINIHNVLLPISFGKMARSSLFPLANEIMFFYMLVSFSAVFAFFKEKTFWKKYAAIIGSLTFFSIVLGDPATIGKISEEDAVGIWIGLTCGALFSGALFLWRKFNLPKMPAILISDFILLIMAFFAVIVIHFQIFSKDSMGELVSRLVNWQAAWNLIKENPFGVGFGSYGATVMQHWPTSKEAYFQTSAIYIAAHNQYLQILTEIGWLGLFYYCALFAFPWFFAIFHYLKTGERHLLFIAGTLAAVLSIMEVSEAISMFAFVQIIHWAFLIYCVKAVLPILPPPCQKYINLRFLYLLPFMILAAYLLFDRGKQLQSKILIDPLDRGVRNTFENHMASANKALEIYPKNHSALWHRGYLYFLTGESEKALKDINAVEEVSGYFRPISYLRAKIYIQMGDKKKACKSADYIFKRYEGEQYALELKRELNDCKD